MKLGEGAAAQLSCCTASCPECWLYPLLHRVLPLALAGAETPARLAPCWCRLLSHPLSPGCLALYGPLGLRPRVLWLFLPAAALVHAERARPVHAATGEAHWQVA